MQKNLVQNRLRNSLITKPVVISAIAGNNSPHPWLLAYQRLRFCLQNIMPNQGLTTLPRNHLP
jgi:hypothetical protein